MSEHTDTNLAVAAGSPKSSGGRSPRSTGVRSPNPPSTPTSPGGRGMRSPKRSATSPSNGARSPKSPRGGVTSPAAVGGSPAGAVESDREQDQGESAADVEPADIESDNEGKVKIEIKTLRELRTVFVFPSANVKELKEVIAHKFTEPFDKLCLIHSGKVLADYEPLDQYGITDGSTVHLVIKTPPPVTVTDETGAPEPILFGPGQFARFGLSPINYVQLQQQMQKQMMGNPAMIRQLVHNPLVQQLMENPEVMKSMIQSVPHTKEMLERNPDINEMLNDPEVMKQTLEVVRDPKLLDELIEAQMKADAHAMGASKGGNIVHPTTESAAARLPTDMQTMLTQMSKNSAMLQQMMKAPYMPAMLQGLAANPQWSQLMIQSNPMFAGNPKLQQQISNLMPIFIQQIQNPDMQSLMTNPRAMQAMLRIQQGLDTLHSESPNLSKSVEMPFISMPPTASSLAAHLAPPPKDDDLPASGPRSVFDPVTKMMTQLVQQMAEKQISKPVDVRYSKQLELLESMGFDDKQANLAALTGAFGDVDAAAEHIIQQSGDSL